MVPEAMQRTPDDVRQKVDRSKNASPSNGAMAEASFPAPGVQAQREAIAEAMKLKMSVGQVWYVVCSKWFQLWKAHVQYDETAVTASVNPVEAQGQSLPSTIPAGPSPAANGEVHRGTSGENGGEGMSGNGVAGLSLEDAAQQATAIASSDEEGHRLHRQESQGGPGPIDNRTLVGEDGDLREGMMDGEDYVLLHHRAYELLEAWHGGGPRFKRWVISLGNGTRNELMVELFPVKFFVYECLRSGKPDPNSRRLQLYSRTKTMRQVCADVKASLNLTPKVDTRLSLKKPEAEPDGGGAPGEDATSSNSANDTADGDEIVDDGWQEIHLEEVSQSLDQVVGDTQSVALLVETKDTSDPERSAFPRDPIVHRWRYNLKEGDLLDARDRDKIWFEAKVTQVNPDGDTKKVKVHFLGWSDTWDEVIERSSATLQKLHTYTPHWREDLRVNSEVELSGTSGGKKKWYLARVEGTKHEDGVRLLDVHAPDEVGIRRWVAEDSEEICITGTHIRTKTRSSQSSSSVSHSTGSFHRSNTRGAPLAPGSVGLTNLGNTCFMNSMLQCLLATEALSTYFRNFAWKNEINENNPLGMGGKVAQEFAGLNDAVWSGQYSVVVPATLKKVVADYAPMFSGYNQHDAGELMSFLLDGIHEDLNRVHLKPYMEPVDSAGRKDAVIAEESWKRYLMRNDSIMVDSCTGLLRSHVTCPVCQNASVTFDPYTSLSVPLPVEDSVMVEVLFQPLPYGTRPTKMAFTLTKESKVSDLKSVICLRVNSERKRKGQEEGLTADAFSTNPTNGSNDSTDQQQQAPPVRQELLSVFEVWSSRVFKRIEDDVPVSEMKEQDDFVVCQLEFPEERRGDAAKAGTGSSVSTVSTVSCFVPQDGPDAAAGGSGVSGVSGSQAAGDAQGEERQSLSAAAAGAGFKAAAEQGRSLVIDVVLSTGPYLPLKGGPRRISCREGVTNREIHEMIRQHVSRFVPSVKSVSLERAKEAATGALDSRDDAAVEGESNGCDAMVVDEPESEEPRAARPDAGTSSSSDLGSDYVHVSAEESMMVLGDETDKSADTTAATITTPTDDSDKDGHDNDCSPFVHVKKKAATSSAMAKATGTGAGAGAGDGGGVVTADSEEIVDEEETEDEVWNDATTVSSSNDGTVMSSSEAALVTGGGDAVLVSPEGVPTSGGGVPTAGGTGGAGSSSSGGGVTSLPPLLMGNGDRVPGGREASEDKEGGGYDGENVGGALPYEVFSTDSAGSASNKMSINLVPVNDEAFNAIETPQGYMKSMRNEDATLKVQFKEARVSELDVKEMDAFDEHPSLAEAKAKKNKRLSIPLSACFDKYTEREQLGQSELWYCGKCKAHRQAHKKLDVYTVPDVLIVVLKRFYSRGNSLAYRQKLDDHVTFPVRGLDLSRYIEGAGGPIFEDAPPLYDLYAVSEHSGSLRAGHYTAIAMNSESHKWYSFNDSSVSETNPDRSLGSLPYVLFYKRRKGSLRWAGMNNLQD